MRDPGRLAGRRPKTVPVNAVVTGTPADGFEVADDDDHAAGRDRRRARPVTLAGLTSVETQPVDVERRDDDRRRSPSASTCRPASRRSASTTFDVSVTLRPTERPARFSAGLVLVGAEPDRTYTLGVDSVVVTLGGGDQALDAVDAASFAASVNVAGLDDGLARRRRPRRRPPASARRP